jgi:mono/diheme cytochrome c family protein
VSPMVGIPAVVLLLLFMLACSDSKQDTVAKALPGPVEVAEQRPGDPARGYKILVEEGYVTCGMPYDAWSRVARPPASVPTLPGRTGHNAELPYYLTAGENEDGVVIVSTNCLLCHAGLFNGKLVIGMGDESLDFTGDSRELVDMIGSYVSGEAETAAWKKWASRVNAIAPYMMTDTVGVNPAPNLTLALIAHRDPVSLNWSPDPLIAPPPEHPLPVSVPPLWRMGKKHALFYNAMGRGDHARFMMMKSLFCTDSVDEARSIDAQFVHVRAYLASLQPPAYGYAIDQELAREGQGVFESQCARCHGTYGTGGEYPNLVVDLETVGTDPAYALKAYDKSDRFMKWFNRSWYGEIAYASPARGYTAPPLDGVWATAPFLHNGSVPTIRALLNSQERPVYWTRSYDSQDYDTEALGWRYEVLDQGKAATSDAARRKRVYDTTLPGYSNAGHYFGDALTEAERRAVIEYLKTL